MKIDTFKILLGLGRHTKYNTSKLMNSFNSSIVKKKYSFWKQYDEFLEGNNWLKEIEYNELVSQNWRNINKKEPNASLPIDLYLELIKNYPFPIPYPLFFITDFYNYEIEKIKVAELTDEWLMDIFSGESFYKLNRKYFTKAEVKQFLICDWLESFDEQRVFPATYIDLIDLYFYAKIKANNLTLPNYVFTDAFEYFFTHRIVQEYFQFICNNREHFKDSDEVEIIGKYLKSEYIEKGKDFDFKGISWQDLKLFYYKWYILGELEYKFEHNFTQNIVQEFYKFIDNNLKNIRNNNEIGDISDFLKDEYIEKRKDFDFNGRTWYDLRRLSDEWHTYQRQKKDPHLQEKLSKNWEKSKVKDFIYEIDGKVWTIKEITSGKLLYDEGNDMGHCVFSYLKDSIAGDCFIFSVSCKTIDDLEKRIATVEISKDLKLIEARGKDNSLLNKETNNIIKKWTNENEIEQSHHEFDEQRDDILEEDNDFDEQHIIFNKEFFRNIENKNVKIGEKTWTINIEINRRYWYYSNKYGRRYFKFCGHRQRNRLISFKLFNEREIIVIISDIGDVINYFETGGIKTEEKIKNFKISESYLHTIVPEPQMSEDLKVLREWLKDKGVSFERRDINDEYYNEE